MEYLPFGETLVDEHINSFSSPFKFNGKEHDEETGNYYYGARYYDPKLSIFISVDPLAEKTMDTYGYCYNNPVRYTDPTGMSVDGWIKNDVTKEITWDESATSQSTTAHGYTYKGMETEKVSGGMRTLYQSDGSQVSGIALDEVVISVDNRGFTIGDTGPYGPSMGPDGIGLTLGYSYTYSNATHSDALSLVLDRKENKFGLFYTHSDGISTASFAAGPVISLDAYNTYGGQTDLFLGIGGDSSTITGSTGEFGASYTTSTHNNPFKRSSNGVQAIGINFMDLDVGASATKNVTKQLQ
jgi:RHS repeat-associated protein